MNQGGDPNATVRVGGKGSVPEHAGNPRHRATGARDVPHVPRPTDPIRDGGRRPSRRFYAVAVLFALLAMGLGALSASVLFDNGGGSGGQDGAAVGVDLGVITQSLADEGFDTVTVGLGQDGGTVVAAGEVVDLAARDRVIELIRAAPGVRSVDAALTVTELPRGAVSVTTSDSGAIVGGTVPREADGQLILDAVATAYPAGASITDELVESPDVREVVITIGGDLSDMSVFKNLTRNLATATESIGADLVLANGADDVLNALFAEEPILFASGTAEIVEGSFPTLDEAAELLLLYPDARLEVSGHTDTRGPAESNQTLSEKRALAVVVALRERGAANELVPVGYGESQPLFTPDDTADLQQANRRIEFRTLSASSR